MAKRASTGNLTLKLDTQDTFDVREFQVHERISALFGIELVAVCDSANVDFNKVLGGSAVFRMQGANHTRTWAGVCHHIRLLQAEETGVSTYAIGIVPDLWLLSQRRNHRMFQQISEPDIVEKILAEWNIEAEWRLTGSYKKRKYRVQYGESDFAFVCRMLEDAGISFFFERIESQTKLILSDTPHLRETRAEPLPFHDNAALAPGEHIFHLSLGQKVRPGRYTIRDHDYRRPASYRLSSSAEHSYSEAETRLERYHYTPGAFLFGASRGDATPHADDKGKTRTDEAEGQALAEKRLHAKRAQAKTCTFETNALDLAPGIVMQMSGHPREQLNAEEWLVLEVSHSGASYGSWTHRVEVASTAVPFRPPLSTPKPKVNGVESATVVGPAGEEIHTDEFGRVRVHFHWDRESKMDDNSSCWIHVSQPWGGAGYGGTNLPRVGQEVLVDFLGGDPDRPVIIGRVYTNLQKTPYKLPENKTQSGWKSNSTGGGGGYNEIMFEDAAGKELVRMQAERDLNKLVKHDEQVKIGNDRTKQVGHDDALTVENDRTRQVGHDETVQIGNDRTRFVGNNESVTVGNNRTKTIGTNESLMVGANQTEQIGANRSVQVGANQSETIGANMSLNVGATKTETVALASVEAVGAAKTLSVGGAYAITVGGAMTTDVALVQTENVGLTKTVTVGDKITITCGASTITMDKAGTIVVSGTDIAVRAKGNVNVEAAGTVNVNSAANVTVNGPTINMN